MNKYALVLFLGIVMISSTISISSSEAFLPENLPDVSQASQATLNVRVIEGENIIAYARPLYTSLDDPSKHVVPTNQSHDGVAKLILVTTDGTFGCSGTLANDKKHVFTAAHCVTDNNGNYVLLSGSYATFEGDSESIQIDIDADPAKSKAHPDYDGDFIKGNDIAILELKETAPLQIPGILHATSGSEVDDIVDKNGYGYSGYFISGADRSTYPFGTERSGQNKYDAFADTMYEALGLTSGDDFIPEAIYQYDSDDGNSPHDAFDFFFGISDLGLTLGDDPQEVISAPGDSGGPTILNGELVGVTSYGIALEFRAGPPPRTSDCTTEGVSPILDSSCGEFAGDTRVSKYTTFIESVLSTIHLESDPTISIDNITQPEGDAGTTSFTFTITRSSDVGAISVDYATADGTGDAATEPSDYTAVATTTVDFVNGGALFKEITIDVNGDTDVEPDENFVVNLTNCSGCTISDNQGVGTITNDDTPVGVSVDSILPTEIAKGTTLFGVKITGSGFQDGASVTFENGCGPSPSASTSSVSADGTEIIADITTKSGGPNKNCTFDVRVTNTDTSTGVGSQFTVLG